MVGRWTHVAFLLGAGVLSSILVGAWTPMLVTGVLAAVSAFIVEDGPKVVDAPEGRVPAKMLEELSDQDRKRLYGLESTRDAIEQLIAERETGTEELWEPELRRVDDALLAFARLARRRARNEAFLNTVSNRTSPDAHGAQVQLERTQNRLEHQLADIERTLTAIRDRLASRADTHATEEALGELRTRVEALERAEAEIRQLSAASR
ncbi:MAG: hypothetical protein ACFB9M_07280 [Myxococcota bacterium]